jgi:nitrogenase molybdenum-iron protein beta chain
MTGKAILNAQQTQISYISQADCEETTALTYSTIEQPRFVCALGAQQTVLAIPGGVPVIHAGPGCSSKVAGALTDHSGYQGAGRFGGSNVVSTNFSESEVVFGGEDKLRGTIDGALKVMAGDFFIILTGCAPDIVGDDSASVAREFKRKGILVTSVETGGFKGNNFYGHELVNRAIIEDLLSDKREPTTKGLINIFCGIPFQDTFWRGDLSALAELLRALGLKPNLLYGYESEGLKAWQKIPKAELTLVVSPWLDVATAELIKNRYDIPFFHWPAPPIGAVETTRFLTALSQAASLPSRKLNKLVAEQESIFYSYLTAAAEYLTESRNGLPSRFSVISGSSLALALSRFLVNELGFTPGKVVATDEPPDRFKADIVQWFKQLDGVQTEVVFESCGGKAVKLIADELQKEPGQALFASSWEKDLESHSFLVEVSIPIWHRLITNRSYLGYHGGLRLLEDLHAQILGRSA